MFCHFSKMQIFISHSLEGSQLSFSSPKKSSNEYKSVQDPLDQSSYLRYYNPLTTFVKFSRNWHYFQSAQSPDEDDTAVIIVSAWQSECLKARKKHKFFYHSLHLDRGTFQQLKNVMHSILTTVDSDLFQPFEGKCFNLSNCQFNRLVEVFGLTFEGEFCNERFLLFYYSNNPGFVFPLESRLLCN